MSLGLCMYLFVSSHLISRTQYLSEYYYFSAWVSVNLLCLLKDWYWVTYCDILPSVDVQYSNVEQRIKPFPIR